jgi:hypothetical protein
MRKTLLFVSFLFIITGIHAQSIERYVIGAAGGTYNDGTNYVDYTSGEVVISTVSNVNNFLTQGFQQPFTNQYVAVEEVQEPSDFLRIYPNPAVDHVSIEFSEPLDEVCKVMLMDGLGQLLLNMDIVPASQSVLSIDLSKYATGQYYLRIYKAHSLIKTEQIIKINQ